MYRSRLGKNLGKVTLDYVSSLNDDVEIIAGGGIRSISDIFYYEAQGANNFSVSTLCVNPIMFYMLYRDFTKHLDRSPRHLNQ